MIARSFAARGARSFLDALNPQQRRAAEVLDGPVLILAGAGTGKTRTITYRTANLLLNGVDPAEILCVTFTNKAAGEMRERIRALVGAKAAKDVTACTFHSLCARILRRHAKEAGRTERFTIYDASDQAEVLRKALAEVALPAERPGAARVASAISLAKSRGLGPDEFDDQVTDWFDEIVAVAFRRYDAHLRAYDAVDFDDLLLLTLRLFREHPRALEHWQRRFQRLMIDEFQDTSGVQLDIAKMLAKASGNICAVGDDDQSIYSWRGAARENILSFQRHFPGTEVVTLVRNYRSTGNILKVANAIISADHRRTPKVLEAVTGDGVAVDLMICDDERDEARRVVRAIEESRLSGRPLGDHAILVRASVLTRLFEEKLRLADMPCVVIGGQRFFDRREIKDLLAYLSAALNPRDRTSLLRILNTPPRGIGRTTVEKLVRHASREEMTVHQACTDEALDLGTRARKACAEFARLLSRWRKAILARPLSEVAQIVVEDVDYREELVRGSSSENDAERRWRNVRDLIESMAAYERENPRAGARQYLAGSALSSDSEDPAKELNRGAVTLITVHSCKGLEFPWVFVVACEDGVFPHRRSVAEAENNDTDADPSIDEERRLLYVAVTRAQKRLTISLARERSVRGHSRTAAPSRFLADVPRHLLVDSLSEDQRALSAEEQKALTRSMMERMRGE